MRAIADSNVPAPLQAIIASEARLWPHTDGKSFLARKPPTHSLLRAMRPLPGLVLHYDIMRPYSLGYGRYEDDPALSILDDAEHIVVVSLLPPVERLVRQFLAREDDTRARKSARALTALRYKLLGRDAKALKRGQAALLTQYRTPGWIDGWYRRWLDYLTTVSARRPNVRSVASEGLAEVPDHSGSKSPLPSRSSEE